MTGKVVEPLRSENDYTCALKEIERYFCCEPEPGSPEADCFNLLAALIEKYEDANWAI